MPFGKFKKEKISRMIVTASDVGGIFISLVYTLYVGMLLFMDMGYAIINYIMLGITTVYIFFYIFKIFYINRINLKTEKLKRTVKFAYRYSKYGVKLTHAIIVILSAVNMRTASASGNMAAIVGLIVIVVLLCLAIAWDIAMYFVKRKLHEVLEEWNSMDFSRKKDKIDFIIEKIILSLDNMSILDDYVDVGIKATSLVKTRLKWGEKESDTPPTQTDEEKSTESEDKQC